MNKSLVQSTFNKLSAINNSFANTIKYDLVDLRIDSKNGLDNKINEEINSKRNSIISKIQKPVIFDIYHTNSIISNPKNKIDEISYLLNSTK